MRATASLSVALALLLLVALAGGRQWLSPAQLWQALSTPDDFLIWVLRGPRVLTAACAGSCLGLAGALMQGLVRNPLATPDVLGLVQGAGLGHMLALSLGAPLFAGEFAGAVAVLAVLGVLSRGTGPLGLVLYGIGVGATATAATTILLLRAPDGQASQMMLWLSGSLARSDADTVLALLAVLLPSLVALAWQARRLDTLWLSADLMRALGVDLAALRLGVMGLVALLTAGATLAVGPIAFLAFAAAPLARAVTGAAPPALLPATLMGACLLTGADLAARLAAPLVTLPTGLVMTLLGAPYLIWFLARDTKRFAP